MKKILLVFLLSGPVLAVSYAQDKGKAPVPGAATDSAKSKKPAGITDKVKSSRKIDGLFTIYQDTATGAVQLYIKKNQLGKGIYLSELFYQRPHHTLPQPGYAPHYLCFKIEKAFDKLEFSQVNTKFLLRAQRCCKQNMEYR